MSIKDYSKYFDKNTSPSNHAPFFPKNIFAIIAGSTGCGKTNLLFNFLFEEGYLDYGQVYFYSSTLHQEGYKMAMRFYNEMENDVYEKTRKYIQIAHFLDINDDDDDDEDDDDKTKAKGKKKSKKKGKKKSKIIDPKELDPKISHVMVFDDVMLNDQTKIKEYFCRGRHNNVNIFYLCQSLHKIAKHCIRENANVFILFHQDDKTLEYFHKTHISGDMNFKEFKAFCDGAWTKKHGFVVINIWEESHLGRYISNYENIYIPTKYIKIQQNT